MSMDLSHQAQLNGVFLLKINEKPFRTKHVFINISGTAPPNFKFKVSNDLCHQIQLNVVVLLKIEEAVHEILMKNYFVRNMISLISFFNTNF